MASINLKKNIHKAVDKINDQELLQAVYTILEREVENAEEYALTSAQKKELERRLTNHKSGKSKSHAWEEVKTNLLNRKK